MNPINASSIVGSPPLKRTFTMSLFRFSLITLSILTLSTTALAQSVPTPAPEAPTTPDDSGTEPPPVPAPDSSDDDDASDDEEDDDDNPTRGIAAPATTNAATLRKAATTQPNTSQTTGVAAPATRAKVAAARGVAAPPPQDPLKSELDEYWSTEGRELEAITNRLYSKDGRFQTDVFVGIQTASFYWYLPLGLRLTYNFNNFYALELSGSYLLSFHSSLYKYLEKEKEKTFKEEHLDDKFIFRSDLAFIWRPFYGKFGLFSKKLAHIDFNFAIGAGVNGVDRPNKTLTEIEKKYEFEVLLGAGLSLYVLDSLHLRVDARTFVTRGPERKHSGVPATSNTQSSANNNNKQANRDYTYIERVHAPVELSFGIGYLF